MELTARKVWRRVLSICAALGAVFAVWFAVMVWLAWLGTQRS